MNNYTWGYDGGGGGDHDWYHPLPMNAEPRSLFFGETRGSSRASSRAPSFHSGPRGSRYGGFPVRSTRWGSMNPRGMNMGNMGTRRYGGGTPYAGMYRPFNGEFRY